MDANEDKIINTLEGGQRLVESENLYSPKVKDKINSIQDRSEKINNILLNTLTIISISGDIILFVQASCGFYLTSVI